MEVANVQGEVRQPGGRHANERLRRRGMIPAIIYGHGEEPENVAISRRDLELALEHLQHVIQLQVDGGSKQYLIKDVQYDHLHRYPIHADLMRVDMSEKVHVKVALELRGDPVGVRGGGVLIQSMSDLDVECALRDLPEVIRVEIDGLDLNHVLHVKDLALPPGVRAMSDPEAAVVAVRAKKAEVEALEGEAAAAPEVIGRVAKDQEQSPK